MSEESRKHNSHAAESWRELAGDVRQWADGHRLAITATVALVVLNLVVWLVVAMAGFAFPLRLDTSMAEFDFGKLFCTLFLARGVIQLILDAALWLVMLSIAEPWLGRARTVGTALACALGGVIVGLTLCAAGRMAVPGLPIRLPHAVRIEPAGVAGRRAHGGQRVLQPPMAQAHPTRRLCGDPGHVALQRQPQRLLHTRRRADRPCRRPCDGRAARARRSRMALAAQHLLRGAAHIRGHRRGTGPGAGHRHHLP